MATWLELHCDRKLQGTHPRDVLRPLCDTDAGEIPGALCRNDAGSRNRAMASLRRDARKNGWTTYREGGHVLWACPQCSRYGE